MKHINRLRGLIGFFVLLAGAQSAFSQKATNIFSSETPLTYFGIDFSEARLIDDAAAVESDVRNKFAAINQVIINEPKKYVLTEIFHKSSVSTDINPVVDKGSTAPLEKIKSSNASDRIRFTKATVEGIVKGYKFGDHKGTGVIFIMESMNKSAQEASMYVTFFDIASKKIILTERMVGKAGGFGFKNYWTGAVFKVMKEIDKDKYEEWRSKNP